MMDDLYMAVVGPPAIEDGIEITPAMIEAGANRLWELGQAGAGLSCTAEEVFRAMYSLLGATSYPRI